MKTLFLIRHAKSSWSAPDLKDEERPLNDRGNRDAPMVARRMAQSWPVPDKIICSQAQRAQETAAIMSALWWNERSIEIDRGLYDGSASSSLEIIARIPADVNSLALVFHNPTITYLSNVLAQLSIPNVPTCGIVILRLKVESWDELEPGTCELIDFEYPKRESPPS
jgi:phosphohistidine phosphatase